MSVKVAVCSRSFSKNETLRKELLAAFPDTKFNDAGESLVGNSLIEYLQGVDRAVIALEYLTEDILSQLPDLKVVGKYGVGLDKLDLSAMSKANVKLGWTSGVNSTAVAELTLAMALDLVRKISKSREVVANGKWTQVKGRQISSLEVGVVGYGHVGSKVAKLFNAFGARVSAYDVKDLSKEMQSEGIKPTSWEQLVEKSDLITVHVPYCEKNHHLFDHSVLGAMKPGSFIINTARGGLINEQDLLEHLRTGHIKGAGLDVFEVEPPNNNPLALMDNVLVTSHIGGSSEEAILAMGRAAIEGLKTYRDAIDYL